MRLLFLSGNGIMRTSLKANAAASAFICIYRVGDKSFANAGRALFLINVSMVFIPEITQGSEHRVRSGLTQTAQRSQGNGFSQVFKKSQFRGRAAALGDISHDFKHTVNAHAAGYAFATGFVLEKRQEVPGNINHALTLIHHHHTAGADHGSGFGENVIVNRQVKFAGGQTPSRRTANLDRLNGMPIRPTTTDIEND